MNKSMSRKFYLLLSSVFIFLIHLLFVFARVKPANSMTRTATVSAAGKNMNVEPVNAVKQPSVYDSLKLGTMGYWMQLKSVVSITLIAKSKYTTRDLHRELKRINIPPFFGVFTIL